MTNIQINQKKQKLNDAKKNENITINPSNEIIDFWNRLDKKK